MYIAVIGYGYLCWLQAIVISIVIIAILAIIGGTTNSIYSMFQIHPVR